MKHTAGAGEVEEVAASKKSDWSKTLRLVEMEMGNFMEFDHQTMGF